MVREYGNRFSARSLDILFYSSMGFLCLFHFFTNIRIEDYGADSSIYIGLASSILQKGTYEFNFAPHTFYPPGFPLLLALISAVFGSSYITFVRAMAVIDMLALFASYRLLRQMESRSFALTACLILGTSRYYFTTATQFVGSDVPYFLTSTITLLLALSVERARTPLRRLAISVGIALFLVFSLLIRTVGVSLLPGILAWLSFNLLFGRAKAVFLVKVFAPALVLGIVVFTTWLVWSEQMKHQATAIGVEGWTYVDQLRLKDPHQPDLGNATGFDLLSHSFENLVIQGAHLAEIGTHISWIQPLWYSPVVLTVVGLIAVGWAGSLRANDSGFAEWYFAAYVSMLLLWPFDEGPRFVFPIFTLALLYFSRGTKRLRIGLTHWPRSFFRFGFFVAASLTVYATFDVFVWMKHPNLQAELTTVFLAFTVVLTALRAGAVNEKHRVSTIKYFEMVTRSKKLQLASAIGVAVLVVMGLGVQVTTAVKNVTISASTYIHEPSKQAAIWIKDHTLPNDVIMAQEAPIIHRISGRRVAPFTVTGNAHKIMAEIRDYKVTFLAVNTSKKMTYYRPTEAERMRLLQASYPGSFDLVHEERSLQIFKILS